MKNLLNRFFVLFFVLTISPWQYVYGLPGITSILDVLYDGEYRLVSLLNQSLFHIAETLNQEGNGSGDTSYAWAQLFTFLLLSLLGCLVWTLIDRKREKPYTTLNLWFRNFIRYYLAIACFSYGILKLFALQMPFPSLSQLATPLGEFLPMRLSWMFFGYSAPYQIFSGVMETGVGLLLLNRKTVTLGAFLGVGVFANVWMINLSYDVPVKLYSMQLLIYCLFLCSLDARRLFYFFWKQKPTQPNDLYTLPFHKKGQKIARMVFKIAFVLLFVVLPLQQGWSDSNAEREKGATKPIPMGVYTIASFVHHNDTVPPSTDPMAWKDFIFDKSGMGSIHTSDTLFVQRYGRGYFHYETDTLSQTLLFRKEAGGGPKIVKFHYEIQNENTLELQGILNADSLHFILHKTQRPHPLAGRPFHWISESNR
ncbi:hypothetical protein GC167_00135 [bacterium]|nr:hypothetical protein [bacterium]